MCILKKNPLLSTVRMRAMNMSHHQEPAMVFLLTEIQHANGCCCCICISHSISHCIPFVICHYSGLENVGRGTVINKSLIIMTR